MSGKPTYDHDRIIQLWRSGVPSAAIARRIGCHRRDVNRVIREQVKRCSN